MSVKTKLEQLGLILSGIDLVFLANLEKSVEGELLMKCNLSAFTSEQKAQLTDIIVNRFLAEKDMTSIIAGADTSMEAKSVTLGDAKIEIGQSASDKLTAYALKRTRELETAFIRCHRVLAW